LGRGRVRFRRHGRRARGTRTGRAGTRRRGRRRHGQVDDTPERPGRHLRRSRPGRGARDDSLASRPRPADTGSRPVPASRRPDAGRGRARGARRVRPGCAGATRPPGARPLLRLPRARAPAAARPGRRHLERGQLAGILAHGSGGSGLRGAAGHVLGPPARAAQRRQRDQLHRSSLRRARLRAGRRCRLSPEWAHSPDRGHLRAQPVSGLCVRAAVGHPRRRRDDRRRRPRPAPQRVPRRLRRHAPAGSGHGSDHHLVPGGRLPDRRAAYETPFLPWHRERPVRASCPRPGR
jgi:hypothetical protein